MNSSLLACITLLLFSTLVVLLAILIIVVVLANPTNRERVRRFISTGTQLKPQQSFPAPSAGQSKEPSTSDNYIARNRVFGVLFLLLGLPPSGLAIYWTVNMPNYASSAMGSGEAWLAWVYGVLPLGGIGICCLLAGILILFINRKR